MGGDTHTLSSFHLEEDSSLKKDSGIHVHTYRDDENSSNPVELDYNLRRKKSAYDEIMRTYDEFSVPSERLYQAKDKILRYTPGSWTTDSVNGLKLFASKATTLLLVGPKGSGKSSIVNKISRVFEDDKLAPERAQVTYNSSCGNGTFFFEEYMIPRSGSTSFFLFDTRSLSEDFAENVEMIKLWMTKGIRRGEPVIRDSDSSSFKKVLECKAGEGGSFRKIRKVNSVIYVVNGFSVLRSMSSDKEDGENYIDNVVKTFNCPYLSCKDDKPVVAVTHGDLLSLEERARVRIYLGEKLGVPPTKQIFDIPENSHQATELTILDMLRYSLEHAEKNRPYRGFKSEKCNLLRDYPTKVYLLFLLTLLFLLLLTGQMLRTVSPTLTPPSSNFHSNPLPNLSEKLHSNIKVKPTNKPPNVPLTPPPWNTRRNSAGKESDDLRQESQTTSPPLPFPLNALKERLITSIFRKGEALIRIVEQDWSGRSRAKPATNSKGG